MLLKELTGLGNIAGLVRTEICNNIWRVNFWVDRILGFFSSPQTVNLLCIGYFSFFLEALWAGWWWTGLTGKKFLKESDLRTCMGQEAKVKTDQIWQREGEDHEWTDKYWPIRINKRKCWGNQRQNYSSASSKATEALNRSWRQRMDRAQERQEVSLGLLFSPLWALVVLREFLAFWNCQHRVSGILLKSMKFSGSWV